MAQALAFAALAFAALASACDSSTGPSGTTRFAPLAADSVFIGKTIGVVTLSNIDGNVVTAAPQVWSSSDTNVAIVIAGRVFAVGAGTARITAELDEHRNTVDVRVVPQWVDRATEFAQTSTGHWANCAISTAGAVGCRSLADPDSSRGLTPLATGAPTLAVLHTAQSHQCGLTPEGALYCRGWNTRGEFGGGHTSATSASNFVVAAGSLRFSTVATGINGTTSGHTCGIQRADSLLFCFGANQVGQTGKDPPATQDSVPHTVGQGFRALNVAAGNAYTCAIALDKQAYCWGLNLSGVLGRPRASVNFTATPQLVEGGLLFMQLSAYEHTCGVTPEKVLYCWGSNAGGQLGLGTRDNLEHATPTRVPLDAPVAWVTTATGFTCAIADSGDLYCWGNYPMSIEMANRLGERRNSPTHVARGLKFRSVSTSAQNVCGVTTDSRLVCF